MGVVVAVVGYCVWPYVLASTPDTSAKQAKTLPEISLALLNPTLSPPPDSDPFVPFDEVSAQTFKVPVRMSNGRSGGDSPPAQTAPSRAGGSGASNIAAGLRQAGKMLATSAKGAMSAATGPGPRTTPTPKAAAAKPAPKAPVGTLALQATSIEGDQRIALINNQLYQVGESLESGKPAGTPPLVVKQILPDKVVLERDGRLFDLNYSNTARAAAPSKFAGKPASQGTHRSTVPKPGSAKKATTSAK
jgi:hypothetical protein